MKRAMWIAFDRNDFDVRFYDSREEARRGAEMMLDGYRDQAPTVGWPETMDIGYGMVVASTVEHVIADKSDYSDEEWKQEGYEPDWDRTLGYELEPMFADDVVVNQHAADPAAEVWAELQRQVMDSVTTMADRYADLVDKVITLMDIVQDMKRQLKTQQDEIGRLGAAIESGKTGGEDDGR